MTTYAAPTYKRSTYRDVDGVLTMVQGDDEARTYAMDFGDALASGEAVASVTVAYTGGVTATAVQSGNTVGGLVTGSGGSYTVTATTDAGQILEREVAVIGAGVPASDYSEP